MNTTVFHRRRAERFAQLLEEANGGRRQHVRSTDDRDLAELVAIGHRLPSATPAAEVDPDFRSGLRAMLVATAEREGIGATAAPEPAEPARARWRLFRPALNGRRARTRGAIVIGVAVGAVAVSGISAASVDALPGDALYGMKRSTERAQLALTGSDLSRGQLFLDFARTRLTEAGAVRGDNAGFAAVLDDMDADTREGVKLLTTASTGRTGATALDAITTFVGSQRGGVTGMLDGRPAGDRERASASLALLDSVEARTDRLRAALACGAAPTGSDALGPLPGTCAASTPGPGPAASEAGTANRGGPAPTTSRSVDTTPTVEANPSTTPSGSPSPAPSASPSDPPSPTPPDNGDGGLLGGLGRLLDGILN